MANRWFNQFNYTVDKGVVNLFGVVNIGATGAPTLQQWKPSVGGGGTYAAAVTGGFRGVKSITRTTTGVYVVTFQDTFQRVMSYGIVFQAPTSTTPAAPIVTLQTTGTNVGSLTSPQVTFNCQSATGSLADPASGEIMLLNFVLQNSTAQ